MYLLVETCLSRAAAEAYHSHSAQAPVFILPRGLHSGKHTLPEWPQIAGSKRFQTNGS